MFKFILYIIVYGFASAFLFMSGYYIFKEQQDLGRGVWYMGLSIWNYITSTRLGSDNS